MRNLCPDEGILQSYYDGELEPLMLEQVAAHLAACAACALAAREVESEMEFATAAFAHELSLNVPTERLRTRLDEAIAGLQPSPAVVGQKSAPARLREWFATLVPSFNFASPRALGFAGLAAFFVMAAVTGSIVMRQREAQPGAALAGINNNQVELTSPEMIADPIVPTVVPVKATTTVRHRPSGFKSQGVQINSSSNQAIAQQSNSANVSTLPGEKNYLQAISVLTDALEANGEASLQPTLLTDYKRNLAVVDQAITATQRTARSNPKSTDAAEMLYAAYQSKLDLLSAVAEQSRPLIAER